SLVILQKLCHCPHSDLSRFIIWEMEFPGAYAAECDRSDLMRHTASHHILLAASVLLPVLPRQPSAHDRSHRMDHTLCRKIVSLCQDCLPGRLFVPASVLHFSPVHVAAALFSELDSRRTVDGIIDTSVAGDKASQHLAV